MIDFFASIGWAYDLKKPKFETIKAKIDKHGDQSKGGNETRLQIVVDWIIGIFMAFFVLSWTLAMRIWITGGLYNTV